MSCTFWNMRRRLKAQKQTDKVIVDIATAQKAEAEQTIIEKPEKKAVKPNATNKRTNK